MKEYYAFITRSNGLAIRRRNGLVAWYESTRTMKLFLGSFMAPDNERAREIAEKLREEQAVML